MKDLLFRPVVARVKRFLMDVCWGELEEVKLFRMKLILLRD